MNSQTPGASPDFDLQAYLVGPWAVDRMLFDRASGTRGTFTGVVLFSPMDDDGSLAFHEYGTVRWTAFDGAPFSGPATRDYVLRPTGAPDAMDVYFPDGRPFHRISFSEHAGQDQHWCDPDTYAVRYTMTGPDSFAYSWDVSGPAKDLLLDSTLKRLDATAASPPAASPPAASPTG